MVSVVVPAYNAQETIDECVRSLLELDYPRDRLSLFVVDNDSTDRTADALEPYRTRLTVVHERRRGPGAARNAGVRRSRGEIVAFTDADCLVDERWLAKLVAPLEDRGVGAAGGEILTCPGANEVERFGERIHDHRAAIETLSPPYAITMNWASRRDVLDQLAGFDPGFRRGEDVDLSYRILQAGYRLAFAPGALVYHRNEQDLRGLFREGFAHGLHGVKVRKRHAAYLAQLGHPKVNLASYRTLGASLLDWGRGRADPPTRCEAAFSAGKKVGKWVGSARFRHLDL